MSLGLRARLLAAVAAAAIAVSGLLPVAPALADEPSTEPTSSPTAEPTQEPTQEPTAEPTVEPTSEPTLEPTPEPTASPTVEPTATPSPTPTATAATTASFTGTFTRYSSEDRLLGDEPDAAPADDGTALFTVPEFGFLRVDVTQLPTAIASGSATVRFAVPAGLVLSTDAAAAFQQLSAYSTSTAPVVALSALPGRVSARSTPNVNQTPNTPAVHEVYAVLVSPSNGAKGADQTAAKVAASLAGTSDYWGQQSSGSVTFHLAGTTTWYASANSCKTDAGSTALWNQAASVAASQLGYAAARNVHLVLFFSGTTDCGGSLGLGTIGWSANEGGAAWVIGTDTPMAQGILSHELGHNLSFGHANWARCSRAQPSYAGILIRGTDQPDWCLAEPYGDLTDVMGYSQTGRTGGALSSAQAIRGSIWPTTAYDNAPVGTTDYTLNAVSTNNGLRSVVIEDPYAGDRFFVEFRNYTGEDAQYAAAGCTDSACVATSPGVRVLRFEDDYDFVSFPGDDSYLLGRVVSGSYRINYVAGETFLAEGSSFGSTPQVKVEVLSISGSTATVRVTRPPLGSSPTSQLVRTDFVSIVPTVTHDAQYRVGDTWTAMLGKYWSAETYAFQWYRDGVPIGGATQASYTIAPADLGKGLRVSVTGSSTGAFPATRSDPEGGSSYGPIVKGVYLPSQPGSVSITNNGSQLQAATTGFPSGTTFAYQWFRGASATTATTAIAAASTSGYSPVAADVGQFIRLRVVATIPGYELATRYSTANNYSLTIASGSVTISGTPAIGHELSVVNGITYAAVGSTVTPTSFDYQWLRNGTVIAGATSENYTPVSADYNTKLTVRVIAHAPGYVQHTAVSAPTVAIAAGAIAGSGDLPTMVKIHDGNPGGVWTLTATLPAGSITETGVAYAYQWFRDAAAIAGATASVYRPVAADYGFDLSVRVTVTKLNFATRVLTSLKTDYSVYADPGALTIDSDGTPAVGETLGAGFVTYYNADGGVAPVQSWQWYRDGVAIAGATGATYALGSTDFNTSITFRVTSKVTGFLGLTVTSVATPKIAKGAIEGTFDVPGVTKAALKLTAALPAGSITTAGVAYAYQWYRGTAAIAGATTPVYTLTAADYGALVQVRATVTKLNYTTVVLASDLENYSVVPSAAIPVITGELRVGAPVAVADRQYVADGASVTGTVTEAYQWYRAGVAIPAPLGTTAVYTVVTADLGKALTVRVTASLDAFLPAIATSAATQLVGTSTLEGWNDQEFVTVTLDAPSRTLTAASTGIYGPLPLVASYQWYRGEVAVAGAVAKTYALTAADYGQQVWVRVTTTKATFTTVVKTSPRVNYSITGGIPTVYSYSGPIRVGGDLAVTSPAYATKDGPLTPSSITFQWLRGGAAIAGATAFYYTPVAADFNTALSVRVTVAEPGYVSFVSTTPATALLGKGVIEGSFDIPTVTQSSTGLLTASLPAGSITTAATTLAYQWYRNGAAIALATKSTYQLTAADYGTAITVRVIASKPNFTSTAALASASVNYSVVPDAPSAVSGTIKVGETVSVNAAGYTTKDGPASPTVTYQWLRNGVAIVGALASSYLVQPADLATKLSVRVTATVPGFITSVGTSPVTVAVVAGTWQGSFAAPTVAASPTGVLSVAIPSGAITSPGATFTYQWLRNGAAIAGATGATFTLTAADWGKTVSVRATANKPAMAPLSQALTVSAATDYSVLADAIVTVSGTARVSDQLTVVPVNYTAGGSPVAAALAYQWLRNGAVIAGATASSYTVQAADFGTKVTVRVTASSPGWVANVGTSVAAANVIVGTIEGSLDAPVVTAGLTGILSAALPAGSITTPAVTLAYQWKRNGVAVAGATAATFQFTAADWGKTITVTVTVSKLNSGAAKALTSSGADYSVLADAVVTVSGTARVSDQLTVDPVTYTAGGNPVVPTVTYQWLRNAVAIAGATASAYTVQAADFGTKVTVRVTASSPGWVANVGTSVAAANVIVGTIEGSLDAPVVTAGPTGLLSAALPAGSITTPAVALAYQWKRNGAAIAGATAATFQLTAADWGKTITVTVTVSKANSGLPKALTSSGADYSVLADAIVTVSGTARVSDQLTVDPVTYTAGGSPVTPTLAYQWLRNGAVIAGATASSYTVQAADFATKVTVRVTAASPGWVANVGTSVAAANVIVGTIEGSLDVPVVTAGLTGILSAALPSGSITTPAVALAYQWKRNGAAVAGATAATFQLTAADWGKTITVTVTVSKPNSGPAVPLTSAGSDYSVIADAVVTVSGTARVSDQLTVVPVNYTAGGSPVAAALAYQWLRNGAVIAGATASSYTVQAADFGTKVTVRVTASSPGWVANVGISVAAANVIVGTIEGSLDAPVVTAGPTGLLSAALPAGSITTPAVALAYQWKRDSVAIVGATAPTFQLTATDWGKTITVTVTVSKLNSGPAKVLTSAGSNYSILPDAALVITGTAAVDEALSVNAVAYTAGGSPITPTVTYQWLRNGAAIAGAVASGYLLQAADFGTKVSVRVTAAAPGWVTHVVISPVTATVAKGILLVDAGAVPDVAASASALLTASLPAGAVTSSGVTLAYQWYRAGAAIAAATKSTFQLTAVDAGKGVWVVVTASKPNLVPVAFTSPAVDYGVRAGGTVTITGTQRVGAPLTAALPAYTDATTAPLAPTFSYQWLRAGVVISGATAAAYSPVLADLGKALTVRVVASVAGYLPLTSTSAATPAIAAGVFGGDPALLPIITGSAPSVLTVALDPASMTEPGTTLAFQWFRGATAIAGATTAGYILSAATDYGMPIAARVTVTKAGYTTLVLATAPSDFSIYASGDVVLDDPAPVVDAVVGVSTTPSFTKDGGSWSPDPANLAYQWYLNGVAVGGAAGTGPTYTVLAANAGKTLTLRVTAKAPGYLPVSTVSAGAVVALP